MRKVLGGLMVAAALFVAAGPVQAQASSKIGYVDSRRIISESPGAKEAQASFEQDMTRFRAELKVLEDSLKSMVAEYEQKQVMLSPDVKKQREDAIRAKQQAFQTRAQQLEEQASQRQAQLVQPIMNQIQKVIEEIRSEGGYAIIFDRAADAMVAADTSLDLTEQVLTRLRATAAAPSGGAQP